MLQQHSNAVIESFLDCTVGYKKQKKNDLRNYYGGEGRGFRGKRHPNFYSQVYLPVLHRRLKMDQI